MLCDNHHREADAHNTDSPLSVEFRKKLREYTYRLIQKEGYVNTPLDEEYLTKHRTN